MIFRWRWKSKPPQDHHQTIDPTRSGILFSMKTTQLINHRCLLGRSVLFVIASSSSSTPGELLRGRPTITIVRCAWFNVIGRGCLFYEMATRVTNRLMDEWIAWHINRQFQVVWERHIIHTLANSPAGLILHLHLITTITYLAITRQAKQQINYHTKHFLFHLSSI